MDYDTFDAQLLQLADSLRGSDEATIAAEMVRVRPLAEQIEDERDRQLAMIRIDKLPELVNGAKPGTSPQFWAASTLLAQAISDKGSRAERIAHAERAKTEIAELSKQAPVRESMTILKMNSTLARWIERLRNQGVDGGS